MQDTDQWQEQFASRLSSIEATHRDTCQDVSELQNWRISHMSVCHPKILSWMAVIGGGIAGASGVLGYVLGNLIPWLGK